MADYHKRAAVAVVLLAFWSGCTQLPERPSKDRVGLANAGRPAATLPATTALDEAWLSSIADGVSAKPPPNGVEPPRPAPALAEPRIVSLGATIVRPTQYVTAAANEMAAVPKRLPRPRSPIARVTFDSPAARASDRAPAWTHGVSAPVHSVKASNRVSDVFVETDVRQALQSLAEQAGVSVIIDEQVRGHITAIVEEERFEDALRKLLLPLGYIYRQDDRDCFVGLADPESALFPYLSERFVYRAEHRTPEALQSQLPARHHPFVRSIDQGGRMVIEAPRVLADQILQELQQLDRAVPQVVLEVLICVYSPEANFRFGFDLKQGVTLNGLDSATLALDGLGIGGHYGPAGFNTQLNDFRFTSVFLRALEQKGYVKIRAAPRVMAEDGKKAEIHIGRETFFSVQPDGAGVVFRQDIQKVDSGIILELTPTIRAPHVTVNIERAEVSEDIRSDETQGNAYDQFPVINRRRVATTVHVQDGQAIVIGGLTQRQKVDQINKLPILGNLPYVGRVFQRIERREQEAEVAIFITPQIIPQDIPNDLETLDIAPDSRLLDVDFDTVGVDADGNP